MPLTVRCPSCGLEGLFPDEWSGRTIPCARCHAAMLMTGRAGAEPPPGPPAGSQDSAPGASAVRVGRVDSAPARRRPPNGFDTLTPLHAQTPAPPPPLSLEPPQTEPGERQSIGT